MLLEVAGDAQLEAARTRAPKSIAALRRRDGAHECPNDSLASWSRLDRRAYTHRDLLRLRRVAECRAAARHVARQRCAAEELVHPHHRRGNRLARRVGAEKLEPNTL